MADTDTNTVIMDGPQKYLASFVHTYVDAGEGTPVEKKDVTGLSKNPVNGNDCIGVRINKIWYSTIGLSVIINWFATTQVRAIQLPEDYSDVLDFSSFSGLPNTTTFGSGGANGDVYFGTKNEAANDGYTIVLECIKVYAKDNT